MPNPNDYETVAVFHADMVMVDGRKTVGKPQLVGVLHALVAPKSESTVLETGRVIERSGYELVSREAWPTDWDVSAGDLVTVRGETLTVTQPPEHWRRADREIGWKITCERRSDT